MIGLVILLILGYGLFEARRLIEGPTISIDSPAPGSATSSVAVTVTGKAQNISFLTINDAPAYTDESGKFVYRFTPPAGYTVVTIAATDRFGRKASRSVEFSVLRYCPVSQVVI